MRKSHRLLSAAFVCSALAGTVAAAQTSDPDEMQRRLKPGDIITMVVTDGTELHGRIDRLDQRVIELLPITHQARSNEYRIDKTPIRVVLDQVVAINHVDPLGANPRPVFQRSDSFGMLRDRVKTGETVKVTERSGAKVLGRVAEVTPERLVINVRQENPRASGLPRHDWNVSRSFTPSGVEKIERPAPIWDGAIKGATVAALLTLLASGACGNDCTGLPGVYATTAGIGAGIGLGIDALFPAKRLYRAPK